MKNLITLILLVFSFVSHSQVCEVYDPCNYQFPSKTSYDIPIGQNIKIKVYPYSIVRSDSPPLDDGDIISSLNRLNTTFAGGNIEFVWDCNINYINSDEFNTNSIFINFERHGDGLDYYFFTEEATNGRTGSANGVGCETQVRIGGIYPGIGTDNINSEYVSHEVGHVFGLLHTHADGCFERDLELINQSNCLVAGDFLCSTPADPGYIPNGDTPLCIFQPMNMDSGPGCDLEPINNYSPDLENIMSFFHPDCSSMSFTTEQYKVMRYNINNLSKLSKTIIPDGDILFTTSQTISQFRSYFNNIIIKDGATLTINANISMAAGKSITVEKGGKLLVNNATISNYCGEKWKGIIIEGNPFALQGTGSNYSGEVSLNGATIESADVGITTYTNDVLNLKYGPSIRNLVVS